jgi:hypothetical protein
VKIPVKRSDFIPQTEQGTKPLKNSLFGGFVIILTVFDVT